MKDHQFSHLATSAGCASKIHSIGIKKIVAAAGQDGIEF